MSLSSIYMVESGISFTSHAFSGECITEYLIKDMLFSDICLVLAIADKKPVISLYIQEYVSGLFKIYDTDWLLALYYSYKWN